MANYKGGGSYLLGAGDCSRAVPPTSTGTPGMKIILLSKPIGPPSCQAVDAAVDAAFKAEGMEAWEAVADPPLKEILSSNP